MTQQNFTSAFLLPPPPHFDILHHTTKGGKRSAFTHHWCYAFLAHWSTGSRWWGKRSLPSLSLSLSLCVCTGLKGVTVRTPPLYTMPHINTSVHAHASAERSVDKKTGHQSIISQAWAKTKRGGGVGEGGWENLAEALAKRIPLTCLGSPACLPKGREKASCCWAGGGGCFNLSLTQPPPLLPLLTYAPGNNSAPTGGTIRHPSSLNKGKRSLQWNKTEFCPVLWQHVKGNSSTTYKTIGICFCAILCCSVNKCMGFLGFGIWH